jgi:D-glycerate 3-kinase
MKTLQIAEDQILKWVNSDNQRPFFIGIQGPQGSGKTTLVAELESLLPYRVLSCSLDDFYIPHEEQLKLKGNPLLEHRGLPGTHSIDLLLDTFEKLRAGKDTKIPRFDKSLHQGRGDRLPESEWTRAVGVYDIILFEGWCLGFKSKDPFQCDPSKYSFRCSNQDLMEINEHLRQYRPIYQYLDYFIQLKAEKIDFVTDWRCEQELTLKRQRGANMGLSFEQVQDFVSRFMPIYDLYLSRVDPNMLHERDRFLRITLNHKREVMESE